MMRISSTYLERIVKVWGSTILLSLVIITSIYLVVAGFDFEEIDGYLLLEFLVIAALVVFPFVALLDVCILYLKFKPQQLKLNGRAVLGDAQICPEDLLSIVPLTHQLGRVDYKLIAFNFKDGRTTYVLCKPQSFLDYINSKPTRTLMLLKNYAPEFVHLIQPSKTT